MLSAGIVGLPNVGKSTLFNAVTRTQKAQAANYPFCTIDPNVGVVTVPDPRLAALTKLSNSKKTVPAAIEFVDIAGLVKGASAGEGLGNQFLSHIREVHAIVQVVRCFENDDIHHVSGTIDPVRDIEVINTELILADLASVQKRADRQSKAARSGDKAAKAEVALAEKLIPHLDAGKPATTLAASDDEQRLLREFFLLSGKPTIFACNVAEADLANVVSIVEAAKDNEGVPPSQNVELTPAARYVQAVQDYARAHFATEAVVISAQIESELAGLSEEEAAEYLAGIGVASSGVGSLIRAVYHLLGLRTYLTTGEDETRAWTIHAGDKAPAAAGVIHTDFERGFIASETIHFDELIRLGSFAKAREAGKLRIEGKEYVVQDGDVVEFRFNV
ncbi:MAG TPA: redox-regulated ATPase YchF [Chthoniobacteraceae bacterium]|jgi:ribosome-binding ATPase YchF (GTP1/OBG family)|nr:redox-regulated ATPase YchF [Chthoniobacteraceae bacterium]